MTGKALDFRRTDTIQTPVCKGTITQIALSLASGLEGRVIVSINGVHTLINQHVAYSNKAFYKAYVFNLNFHLKDSADLVCHFYTIDEDGSQTIQLTYQQQLWQD